MKNLNNTLVLLLTVAMACVIGVGTLWADTRNDGADFLVEVGKRHYDKGEIADAIHEFSKALMVQPGHPEALKYLNTLGIRKGLYTGAQTRTTEIADLARHVKVYKEQLDHLESEKADMEGKLVSLQTNHETLLGEHKAQDMELEVVNEKLDEVNATITKERLRRAEMIAQVEDMYLEDGDDIVYRTSGFFSEREKKLMEIQKQYNELAEQSLDQENELLAMAGKNNELREETFKLKSDRDALMDQVEEYLYVRRNELDSLRDELLFKQMELAKAQQGLMGKMDKGSYTAGDQKEVDVLKTKLKETEEALQDAYSQIERLLEVKEKLNTQL